MEKNVSPTRWTKREREGNNRGALRQVLDGLLNATQSSKPRIRHDSLTRAERRKCLVVPVGRVQYPRPNAARFSISVPFTRKIQREYRCIDVEVISILPHSHLRSNLIIAMMIRNEILKDRAYSSYESYPPLRLMLRLIDNDDWNFIVLILSRWKLLFSLRSEFTGVKFYLEKKSPRKKFEKNCRI